MSQNDASKEKLDSDILKMALILVVGALAPLFDTTIVTVGIHTIGHDLQSSVSTTQWVTTGYLLALGIVVPISGWILKRFGGKRTWMFALVLFLMGSMLSGLAWNMGSLIFFRVLQGIGGGLIMPTAQNLIVQAAGGEKLGRTIAVIGLPTVLGPILGPVLGGFIVHFLNWRWMFYVNVPICLAALILAWLGLPKDKPEHHKNPFDLIGFVLISPALVAIIYGLTQMGTSNHFLNTTATIYLAIGVLLLLIFIVYALKKAANPIIDLRLFQFRSFSIAFILMFLSGLSLYGAMLILPLYFQQVSGASVLMSGVLLIPQGIGSLLSRFLAGKLTDIIGGRLVAVVGIVMTALGTLPFVLAGPHASYLFLAIALIVRGAGLSSVMIPIMTTAYKGLSKEQIPHASSTTRIIQQIGGAFGAAVFAAILGNQLTHSSVINMSVEASAFRYTFFWSLVFILPALILAIFLPGNKSNTQLAHERTMRM
ncbi:DHA2 family efflux MFS transporter permease subunit [Camelliibacillus cellulosilyticus]|uniref:DHA2 family efflux MFS transporter permease subunit n=1 Tax=Camelliibacillus cellulosilyticus TaxID=2174486 RepID=A0ABV9GQN3_9BACL